MALAIAVRFDAGRYHATPWSKHVNEGAVEWPPSPWRILRWIVAAWQTRANEVDAETMATALEKLAAAPEFVLPPARQAHTRHYMPLYKGERTLVLDSFVVMGEDREIVIVWPEASLVEQERAALSAVLDKAGYFGRAESWCSARMLTEAETRQQRPNCWPSARSAESEPVRLLAADPATAIRPGEPVRKWPLCAETAELRRRRWSRPPGSKWVVYMRPQDSLFPRPAAKSAKGGPKVTVVRYRLEGPVMPLVSETLSMGELARRAIEGLYGRLHGGARSDTLSGKSEDGRPMQGHSHAFYLASDDDRDGRLDHLTVAAAAGFTERELKALDSLRTLRQLGGKPDLNAVLTGVGTAPDFAGMPWFGPSRRWVSATPFVPVRHVKVRGGQVRETVSEQLALELTRRGLPAPVGITALERCELADGRSFPWIKFRGERIFGEGRRGQAVGQGFAIEFTEPVSGPLALGYGCHFGLGLFRTATESRA